MKWLAVIALVGGCYKPAKDRHCELQCASSGPPCPGGMTCGPDLYCHDDDRGACPDGGMARRCWEEWRSTEGPRLGPPVLLLDHPTLTLTNPSLTYGGRDMYVAVRPAPDQQVHHSVFDGNGWSQPKAVTTSNATLVRIRCTLPATNKTAICVHNLPELNLVEWSVDMVDAFSPATSSVAGLNDAPGDQGDPEINRDGTELFYTSGGSIVRATRLPGGFMEEGAITGFVAGDRSPTISPDADIIVFMRGTSGAQLLTYGVRMSDSQWKTATLLVPGAMPGLDTDPELSPDGCQLLVASSRGATPRDIYAFPIVPRD